MSSESVESTRSSRGKLALVAATLLLYSASRGWIAYAGVGSVSAIVAALVPLPALLYVYTAWVLQALRGDELERRIALEGLAIGFGVTFAFVALLAQLEDALPPASLWPEFGDVAFVAIFATFFGVARSRRRYE